ncbi:MAG TPA: hypothetical protein PL070_18265, partial [Flavobacteriales bacterium]|nr:hypothetical protein [Flavobacteriales bacterium]
YGYATANPFELVHCWGCTTGWKRQTLDPALAFVRDAELTPAEKARFARPALNALGRWVKSAPSPNYTTSENLKRTRRFGDELFRALPGKFADTGVDFSELAAWYQEKMEVE